jgi:hypothetical protein
MAAPGWIELFVAPLEALGLPCMVTGSVASTVYGEPRLTLDVDLVLDLPAERAPDLLAAFPESAFYRPPLEVVRVECARAARSLPPDPPRDRPEGGTCGRCSPPRRGSTATSSTPSCAGAASRRPGDG